MSGGTYIPAGRQLPGPPSRAERYADPLARGRERGPYRRVPAPKVPTGKVLARLLRKAIPFGAAIDLLTPAALGSGELTPAQRAANGVLQREVSLPPPPTAQQLDRIARGAPSRSVDPPVAQPSLEGVYLPPLARRAPVPRTAPVVAGVGPPRPVPKQPSRVAQTVRRVTSNPQARTALQVLDIVGSLNRSRQTVPQAYGLPSTPARDALTPFETPGLSLQPQAQSSRSDCHCPPNKRGKARKCLERAPVVFKSGRLRGRSAGSKCIRFASE